MNLLVQVPFKCSNEKEKNGLWYSIFAVAGQQQDLEDLQMREFLLKSMLDKARN